MKKVYIIFLLVITFIFLSTYSPRKLKTNVENSNVFFKIQKIIILNNSIISENFIIKKLNSLYGKNIFLIKREDIEESLKNINFLQKIEVKKNYPETITIKIFETKPLGILLKEKSKYLLDSSSNLIEQDKNMSFVDLPNIFGDGAENYFVNFLNQLKNNKFPVNKIINYYYFGIGRWDLQLSSKKIIKYPYNANDQVIKKSVELLNREDFKNYKIVDLRVDGKIIVE